MPKPARIAAAGFPMHAVLHGIDRSVMVFEADGQRSPVGQAPAAPAAVTPVHQTAKPPA